MLTRLISIVAAVLWACAPAATAQPTPPPLTPNDFLCFLGKYNAGLPAANCDGTGGLTANDFLCFINRYAAGDPAADCDGSGQSGWTDLTPPPGAKVLYVSMAGSDLNPGTIELPFRSVGKVMGALRDGEGDQARFECGGAWQGPINITKGCAIAGKYMVIGSYGIGDPPVINCPAGNGIAGEDLGKRGVAIVGLKIVGNRVNNSCGVRLLSWDDVLLEDLFITSFRDNIVVQAADIGGPHRVKGLRVRRCRVVDSGFNGAASTDKSQGIFTANCDGWMLEGNLFDNNGIPGSIFAHNVYIHETCGPGSFVENITTRSASEGAQQRPGGVMKNNLALANSYDLYFGGPGEVSWNVALDSKNISATAQRGTGLLIDGDTDVLFNFAGYNGDEVGGTGWGSIYGFQFRGLSGLVKGNKVYDWADPVHHEGKAFGFDGGSGVTFTGNSAYLPFGDFVFADGGGAVASSFGNECAAASPQQPPGFVVVPMIKDPRCRISDYMASIQLSGGVAEFAALARLQRKQDWRREFEADAVNDFVRLRAGMPAN